MKKKVEVIDSINTNLTDVGGTEKWRLKGVKLAKIR